MEIKADGTAVSTERPWLRRASWGAIIAGTVVALGIQIMLGFLGMAIGLASINPWDQQNPAGMTMGAIAWLALSGIIALLCGGWVAGRLSGEPRSLDRAINALVVWGLAILLALAMTAATANALIGGALGILRTGASAAGQVANAAAPAVGQALGGPGSPIADVQNQIQQMIQSAQDTTPEARQKMAQDA